MTFGSTSQPFKPASLEDFLQRSDGQSESVDTKPLLENKNTNVLDDVEDPGPAIDSTIRDDV